MQPIKVKKYKYTVIIETTSDRTEKQTQTMYDTMLGTLDTVRKSTISLVLEKYDGVK